MDFNKLKLIDLTYSLSEEISNWNGNCGFQHHLHQDYQHCAGDTKFRVHKINMNAGIGTHMDAPAHCIPGGKSIADIALENLFVPCVVIDIPVSAPDDYKLSSQDIVNFEKTHTQIAKNSLVIVRTGWGKYWNNPAKYRNDLIFPTLSAAAAEMLLERDVAGIGIDTLSPDNINSDFPVHKIMLGAGKYIIENIANAQLLPASGFLICALPIKIKDGTEAPMRLVGIL